MVTMADIKIKGYITGKKKITGKKRDEITINHEVTIKVKKPRYEEDGNLKEGTGDPYMTVTIGSEEKDNLGDLVKAKIGDSVMIRLEVMK